MQGIIIGGAVPPEEAEILRRIWIAGVIPLFVGLALIVNGLIVSKRQAEIARQAMEPRSLHTEANPPALGPADTSEFIPTNFSVTAHHQTPGESPEALKPRANQLANLGQEKYLIHLFLLRRSSMFIALGNLIEYALQRSAM